MNSTIAQQIVAVGQERIENYCHLFSITFLFWDHLLTISDEFHYMWRRPMRATTAFFLLNRYFAVLGNIVVTVSLFATNLTDSSCRPFHTFRELLLLVTQVIVYALLTIRIYALYHCSKRVLVGMVSTGLVLIGLSIFSISFGQSSQSEATPTGCHTQLSFITSVQVAAAWEALFVYDSILFVMILHRGYKTRHQLRRQKIPLLVIILRDGSLYFGVMALANAINISTFYYPLLYIRGVLCTFTSSLSVTLISRIMLNLHKIADSGLYTPYITTLQLDSENYSTFLAPPPSDRTVTREA